MSTANIKWNIRHGSLFDQSKWSRSTWVFNYVMSVFSNRLCVAVLFGFFLVETARLFYEVYVHGTVERKAIRTEFYAVGTVLIYLWNFYHMNAIWEGIRFFKVRAINEKTKTMKTWDMVLIPGDHSVEAVQNLIASLLPKEFLQCEDVQIDVKENMCPWYKLKKVCKEIFSQS